MHGLRVQDTRPFFEKALIEGIKMGTISDSAVKKIVEDGPKGIVQIADTFGSSKKLSGINEGMDQLVTLASFGLAYHARDNVQQAVSMILEMGVLGLSRAGSELVKQMASLPEVAHLGENDADSQKKREYFQIFNHGTYYQSKEQYDNELLRRKREDKQRLFALELYEIAGLECDSVLSAQQAIYTELFPQIITGRYIQSEVEIAFLSGKIHKHAWGEVLEQVSRGYEDEKQFFSFENCLKEANAFYKSLQITKNEDDINEGTTGLLKIGPKLREEIGNTLGNKPSKTSFLRVLLTSIFLGKPKTELGEIDTNAIVQKAREGFVTSDELIQFVQESIPERITEGITAVEWMESTWGKYILDEAVPKNIAEGRLKKVLRLPVK